MHRISPFAITQLISRRACGQPMHLWMSQRNDSTPHAIDEIPENQKAWGIYCIFFSRPPQWFVMVNSRYHENVITEAIIRYKPVPLLGGCPEWRRRVQHRCGDRRIPQKKKKLSHLFRATRTTRTTQTAGKLIQKRRNNNWNGHIRTHVQVNDAEQMVCRTPAEWAHFDFTTSRWACERKALNANKQSY